MKKTFLTSLLLPALFLASTLNLQAQNVGINSDGSLPDNSAMLDVKSKNKGFLLPRMKTEERTAISSPADGLLVFDENTTSIWMYTKAGGWQQASVNNIWTQNNTGAYNLTDSIGIGTPAPQSPVHILSPNNSNVLRVEGNSPYISLYDITDGYRGYLWYTKTGFPATPRVELGSALGSAAPVVIAPNRTPLVYFTATDRVGIGTGTPGEKLDVNGNINLSGSLKVNSSAGTAGQVLTSTGSGAPQWKNSPFSNTTRFSFNGFTSSESGTFNTTTSYNTSPADVSISSTGITINKTGLYHFQITVNALLMLSSSPSYVPRYHFDFMYRSIIYNRPMYMGATDTHHRTGENFSVDEYILAGTTIPISFNVAHNGTTTTFNSTYKLSGYLISE